MTLEKNNIISSIENFLNAENLELYDINIVNFPSISKIEIFIFSEKEINSMKYERFSYQIQRLLDEIGIEKGTYELIVSSPGIERNLKTNRHFQLSINEHIKIKLLEPINDEYVHTGILKQATNEYIVITQDETDLIIDINNIKKTKIFYEKFKEKINN